MHSSKPKRFQTQDRVRVSSAIDLSDNLNRIDYEEILRKNLSGVVQWEERTATGYSYWIRFDDGKLRQCSAEVLEMTESEPS